MIKILAIVAIVIVTLHGLIHLMGLIAYWPLGKLAELPYKTTLLDGRWEIGAAGTRLFSLVWLLAGLGFLMAALGLGLGRSWWAPVLLGASLLSLMLCILDWRAAFRGVWINVAILLGLLVVFGLRARPAPFAHFAAPTSAVQTMIPPSGLPAPVERFYHLVYGDQIPVYHSAVLTGRGTVRTMGITFPARMRFSHVAGQAYRHYMETNFYGIPIMKVNEWYLEGHGRLELPFGTVEKDPCVDSAGNQGLWAESLVFPAIFLTDPRVRWEPLDENNAYLYVPYGESEQVFTIRFDAQTGLLTHFETDRCRDAKVGALRWWGDVVYDKNQFGRPRYLSATWEDEGTPWLVFELEEIVFNADLSEYIRQKGP
ncbi:MAG: hypothetical protein PHS96_04735 [Anaerolineales bacterium]|nr:hypothetical protein [Anaerolineales bacterium]